MSLRSYMLAAWLLVATPSAYAQAPPAISMMTGAPMAAESMPAGLVQAEAPAAPQMTYSMGVQGQGQASNGSLPAAATGAPGASQNVWVVKAGSTNGSLTFSPDTISGAKVGDMIQFQFFPRNHSVAMGDYANACMPMQNREKAFFSGYMPTEEMGRMTFTVPVRDTEPMWLYCTQGKHCQEGMVAVVNPPAQGETLADYKQRAAQAPQNVAPQQQEGGQMGSTTAGQIGGAAPTASPSGPTSAPGSPAQSANAASALGFSAWSLAGIAAAAIFVL